MAHDFSPNSDKDLTAPLLAEYAARIGAWYAESGADRWDVSASQFTASVERSVRKRFAGSSLSPEHLEEYLSTLYVEDLALACGCISGSVPAWEYFVREYRGYLRAVAEALLKGGRGGIQGQELADSLFAELYGLADGKRGERSLFRYFHGRSSLKTWLRAILAQRHIDRIRENRRWEALDAADGDGSSPEMPVRTVASPLLDPHRQKYVARFVMALRAALGKLNSGDRHRLELYYARQKTLAEIGRLLGEHESSVSRNLERTRRELRGAIEEHLRGISPGRDGSRVLAALSEAEILLCFQYAAEDAPIDFRNLFPAGPSQKPRGERGELS